METRRNDRTFIKMQERTRSTIKHGNIPISIKDASLCFYFAIPFIFVVSLHVHVFKYRRFDLHTPHLFLSFHRYVYDSVLNFMLVVVVNESNRRFSTYKNMQDIQPRFAKLLETRLKQLLQMEMAQFICSNRQGIVQLVRIKWVFLFLVNYPSGLKMRESKPD